jgi:hypothetical protein
MRKFYFETDNEDLKPAVGCMNGIVFSIVIIVGVWLVIHILSTIL